MTQLDKIYAFLKQHEGQEFNHRQIVDQPPFGMGITDYRKRFCDLREEWGCNCGSDRTVCTAKEHVFNTRRNYYKYVSSVKREFAFTKPVEIAYAPSVNPTTVPAWNEMKALLTGKRMEAR